MGGCRDPARSRPSTVLTTWTCWSPGCFSRTGQRSGVAPVSAPPGSSFPPSKWLGTGAHRHHGGHEVTYRNPHVDVRASKKTLQAVAW